MAATLGGTEGGKRRDWERVGRGCEGEGEGVESGGRGLYNKHSSTVKRPSNINVHLPYPLNPFPKNTTAYDSLLFPLHRHSHARLLLLGDLPREIQPKCGVFRPSHTPARHRAPCPSTCPVPRSGSHLCRPPSSAAVTAQSAQCPPCTFYSSESPHPLSFPPGPGSRTSPSVSPQTCIPPRPSARPCCLRSRPVSTCTPPICTHRQFPSPSQRTSSVGSIPLRTPSSPSNAPDGPSRGLASRESLGVIPPFRPSHNHGTCSSKLTPSCPFSAHSSPSLPIYT
ncbi:hypothetical protein C8Q79DRAFT_634019 [Trametes meyenii]|nr:hypothetical protein C8Q79DRAFT_634019 [Trametes meyenii]